MCYFAECHYYKKINGKHCCLYVSAWEDEEIKPTKEYFLEMCKNPWAQEKIVRKLYKLDTRYTSVW